MIRPATVADAHGIAGVHVSAWAETYGTLAPPEVLARRTVADRVAIWNRILSGDPPDPHRHEVAVLELAGAVMGFASWGGQRDAPLRKQGLDGEISAIYLLRAVQGRGFGRALMAQSARGLIARGHRGASLWVLRDNPRARAFYDRLGGRIVGEADDDLAGFPVRTVCYAWPELDRLVASAESPGVGSSQK
jgi:ribosomal protein S18 acetylase RimI-like enzyme